VDRGPAGASVAGGSADPADGRATDGAAVEPRHRAAGGRTWPRRPVPALIIDYLDGAPAIRCLPGSPLSRTADPGPGPDRVLGGQPGAGGGALDEVSADARAQPRGDRCGPRGGRAHVAQRVGEHLADARLVDHRDEPRRRLGAYRPLWLHRDGVRYRVPDD